MKVLAFIEKWTAWDRIHHQVGRTTKKKREKKIKKEFTVICVLKVPQPFLLEKIIRLSIYLRNGVLVV